MWGAVWASSSNSHRFVCIFQTEIDCRQIILWHWLHSQIHFFFFWEHRKLFHKPIHSKIISDLCLLCCASQGGFLHFWREVSSVWDLGFLRSGTNLSITSLTARPSCTNSTSRTAKSPTTESKTFSGYLHHLYYCHVAKINLQRPWNVSMRAHQVSICSCYGCMVKAVQTFLIKLHIQLH